MLTIDLDMEAMLTFLLDALLVTVLMTSAALADMAFKLSSLLNDYQAFFNSNHNPI